MPELWYEASDTRDMAARERALAEHTSVVGIVVLLIALVILALVLAR